MGLQYVWGVMERYVYRAINQKGRPVKGALAAANEADLFQQLQNSGLELIDCKPVSNRRAGFSIGRRKVKLRDLIQLFVHLEQLQKAGVPLLEGLADIRDSTESARLRDIMSEVFREVSEGSSLSECLANHPTVFSNITISLIAAGEETGNLSESFHQLIRHYKWTDQMQSKVKKATRYPKILIAVVFGVVWFLMGHVVPQIVEFLDNIDQELPMVTIALIETSRFFENYILYIIGGLVGTYVLFKMARAFSESFRYRTDYIGLHVPVLGPLSRKIALSRFAQTFGVLFLSGLEILKCLDSARDTAVNMVIMNALDRVREQVSEGSPLSTALNNSGEFPSLVVRMVKIGEESGNLSGVLEQVTEFYDKDVNESVDAMISMIEPALIVVFGLIIIWIAIAIFGPVYNSFSQLGA